ncbi:MAG: lipoprotein [Pseudomonas sp.]
MSTKPRIFRIALVGATFLALAACGNKGPLVMPQKPVPVEAHPASEAAPAQTDQPTDQPTDQTSSSTDGTQKPAKDSDGQ